LLDLLGKDCSRLINRYFSQMKSSDPWTPIAKLDEITRGKLLLWEEDGYSLLLTQIADRIICFENVCPHLGWPLDMSAVDEGLLIFLIMDLNLTYCQGPVHLLPGCPCATFQSVNEINT